MGFPDRISRQICSDPCEQRLAPEYIKEGEHFEPDPRCVLQATHVSAHFQNLERALEIRQFASAIFTDIVSELESINGRLATLHERFAALDYQSQRTEDMMVSVSPECFVSTASTEIVSLRQDVRGGIFNRKSCPPETQMRREAAKAPPPLERFNKFRNCCDFGQSPVPPENWKCQNQFSNPEIFFNEWVKDQSLWRENQRRKKSSMLRRFRKRQAKEIEEVSQMQLVPIQKKYKNVHGELVTKKIGDQRELEQYQAVEKRLQRDVSKKELRYGLGLTMNEEKKGSDELYELHEEEKSDPTKVQRLKNTSESHLNAVSPVGLDAKRLSENPVPNLHRPDSPDNIFNNDMHRLNGTFTQPLKGLELDLPPSSTQFQKRSSMRVLDSIREGKAVERSDRALPDVPGQGIIFDGLKERYASNAEDYQEDVAPFQHNNSQVTGGGMVANIPPNQNEMMQQSDLHFQDNVLNQSQTNVLDGGMKEYIPANQNQMMHQSDIQFTDNQTSHEIIQGQNHDYTEINQPPPPSPPNYNDAMSSPPPNISPPDSFGETPY